VIAEFPLNVDTRHSFLKLEDQPARELGRTASLAQPTILLWHKDSSLLQLVAESSKTRRTLCSPQRTAIGSYPPPPWHRMNG
jgi:hypothetical protein